MYNENNNKELDNPTENNFNFDTNSNLEYPTQTYYTEIIVPSKKGKGRKLATYISLVLVTSLVTSLAVGGILYNKFSKEVSTFKQTALAASTSGVISSEDKLLSTSDSIKATSLLSGSSGSLTVAQIAKKVGPSIVGIKMSVKSNRQAYIFGSSSGSSDSEGSGIIISSDGYIMTNYHVVQYADPKNGAGSTTLTVYLPDKREATAKFIGGDSDNDLAVIKVELSDLPVAELGDSSKIEVGDPAVAIGNPLGMEFAGSVTYGVISALNRQITTDNYSMSLIQTDAAINPGNSGGALVNSKGQVIGINSAKISESGVEGLGFAIPMNTAKPIIDQLKTFGYIKGRPLIGISAQDVSESISQMYGIPVGVYITAVAEGGAADKAGIQKGDVLIKLAGTKVKTMSDIDNVKKKYKAGDTVDAVVSRNNNLISVKLTFTEDK